MGPLRPFRLLCQVSKGLGAAFSSASLPTLGSMSLSSQPHQTLVSYWEAHSACLPRGPSFFPCRPSSLPSVLTSGPDTLQCSMLSSWVSASSPRVLLFPSHGGGPGEACWPRGLFPWGSGREGCDTAAPLPCPAPLPRALVSIQKSCPSIQLSSQSPFLF